MKSDKGKMKTNRFINCSRNKMVFIKKEKANAIDNTVEKFNTQDDLKIS